jgi:hypothetical protein
MVKDATLYSNGHTSRQLTGYTRYSAGRYSQIGEGIFDSTSTLCRLGETNEPAVGVFLISLQLPKPAKWESNQVTRRASRVFISFYG